MTLTHKLNAMVRRAATVHKQKTNPEPAAAAAEAPAAAPAAPRASAPLPSLGKVKFDTSGVEKMGDLQRSRAASAENANLQGTNDAINRRLAQMGGGPGGVGLKLGMQAQDASAKRLADANEGINAGQQQELRRIGEMETQVNAQREQALAGMEFSRGEREASEAYASAEAAANREYEAKQRDIDRAIQKSQFGQQFNLAWEQFRHQQGVDEFNKKLSRDMFEEKDMMEKLFGPYIDGLGGGGGGFGNLGGAGKMALLNTTVGGAMVGGSVAKGLLGV